MIGVEGEVGHDAIDCLGIAPSHEENCSVSPVLSFQGDGACGGRSYSVVEDECKCSRHVLEKSKRSHVQVLCPLMIGWLIPLGEGQVLD